jgi:hypothetical protein
MTVQTQAFLPQRRISAESRRNPYDLTIEAIESVMGPGHHRLGSRLCGAS